MINDERNSLTEKNKGSEKSFYILFVLQFVLMVFNSYVDVKLGVCTMALVIVMFPIIMGQASSNNADLSLSKNLMVYTFAIMFVFYLFEIFNPNNVQSAWNVAITQYWFYPIAMAALVPIAIRDKKGIEVLLIIWGIFILFATFRGYWQKSHGFNAKEKYFLYVLGGARTHIIWSGIRYFSIFSDAANYGVHAAMAFTTAAISFFFVRKMWLKIFLVIVCCGCLFGMGISGTRASVIVPFGGALTYTILSRNWKSITLVSTLTIGVFCFFYYTNIGSGNQYIWRMRSAFHPTEDASYLVRLEHREKMKELMITHPIGYGMGMSKGAEQYNPKEIMPYPPDSWLISVWIETGIVGLTIYLLAHGLLFAWCGWILLVKIKHKKLKGLLAAWLGMDAGFFLAAYANDIMQYPNSIVVYIGFALCFAGPSIDKTLKEKVKTKKEKEDEGKLKLAN